jgi:hypothetical protein
MSDNNLHCEKMQAAELERLIRTPSADSQSAEGNSTAYYQTQQKSPRSWTCTATFSAAHVDTCTPACAMLDRSHPSFRVLCERWD